MKQLTNIMKGVIIAFLILIVIVVIGYTQYYMGSANQPMTDQMIKQTLRYNLSVGDVFSYHIVYSLGKSGNTYSINSNILVADRHGKVIKLKTIADTMHEGNTTKSVFNRTIDECGLVSDSDFNDILIPEIQPELPDRLVYPEKEIQNNDTWTMPLIKSGNYNNSESTAKYDVNGTCNYTCVGVKIIDTVIGNFRCAEIQSEINYTLNITTNTTNGTVITKTKGNLLGTDWVDLEKGFLVKSDYDIYKITFYDLSDIYIKANLFNVVYREVPTTSHVTVILNNKKPT